MGTLRLGVNIDHVATLRQARYATMPDSKNAEPDPIVAASLCERAGASGITSGPLSAPNNAGGDGGQDTFNVGGSLTYPSGSFNAANYWLDPEVTATAAAGGGAPSPLVVPQAAVMQAANW